MDLGLRGKKIAITASTDGIGYAVARGFLTEGATVLINGRDRGKAEKKKTRLEEEFGEGCISLYVGDTTTEEGITGMAYLAEQIFGQVDGIVANVGSGRPIAEDRLDIAEWKEIFDVNLFSTVRLVRAFSDLWDRKKGGSIVMVSSLAAYNRISAPYAYAAAKHGISVFSKYLSDDLADRGIRVNGVIPGNVFYRGGRWEELLSRDKKGVREYIGNAVPMKRFAIPEEIADAIVFLSSGRASFITGATLLIDGGQNRAVI